MEIFGPVIVSGLIILAGAIMGSFRWPTARDAYEDAGLDPQGGMWNSGGLAGAWRAAFVRPRSRTVYGTVKRIGGRRMLINGPDGFDRLRDRWFTLSKACVIPSRLIIGSWVRLLHTAGRVREISLDD